jgi:starch phosphorylase
VGWFGKKFSMKDLKIAYSPRSSMTEVSELRRRARILAGDHLKSCSDLVPLVGVGLLYQQGYFRQYWNADGWQQETYPENDFYNLPMRAAMKKGKNPGGLDFLVVKLGARSGRSSLTDASLVDTNIPKIRPMIGYHGHVIWG